MTGPCWRAVAVPVRLHRDRQDGHGGDSGAASGRARATLVFVDVPELLGTIRSTWDRAGARDADDDRLISERSLHQSLMDADLLVLDDLGADAGYAWEGERLFTILNGRYNSMKQTVVTSNLRPGDLARHLGTQGERQVWRIVERAKDSVIRLDGPNLRN